MASTTPTSAASCEACGWAAAFCSMLAFGSFGVPIKSKAATALDIDPLVFQSYKTFMCFITSWLVLTLPNSSSNDHAGTTSLFTFTPWGIVSGLFWVPGGVATVYAVKKAGLAIGVGIGSSFIVLVSFIWGIIIFEERVHSRWAASLAILCMMMGIFGMSYFSRPPDESSSSSSTAAFYDAAAARPIAVPADGRRATVATMCTTLPERGGEVGAAAAPLPRRRSSRVAAYDAIDNNGSDDDGDENEMLGKKPDARKRQLTDRTQESITSSDGSNNDIASAQEDDGAALESDNSHQIFNDESDYFVDEDHQDDNAESHFEVQQPQHAPRMVQLCGGTILLTERQCGMLAAVFCGTWGGSIMVPMKWSPPDTKGVAYLISFAIGASIINLLLWILRFLYQYKRTRYSCHAAYHALPSFHLRILWRAGGTCGLLWSIGNFFSLLSVYYLGEGVGYPLVQTAILVSGLWGIFYFKEVQGAERITKWFLSSLLTVFGILLLGYEHHEK
jgi:glucose uptake protein GlcU